jgi:glucose-6-phosphate isomerase
MSLPPLPPASSSSTPWATTASTMTPASTHATTSHTSSHHTVPQHALGGVVYATAPYLPPPPPSSSHHRVSSNVSTSSSIASNSISGLQRGSEAGMYSPMTSSRRTYPPPSPAATPMHSNYRASSAGSTSSMSAYPAPASSHDPFSSDHQMDPYYYYSDLDHENRDMFMKCTALPQFDSLMAAADRFTEDDKLHLRNLCNDSARCMGLTTTFTSTHVVTPSDGAALSPPERPLQFRSSNRSVSAPVSRNAETTPPRNRVYKIVFDYSRQCVNGEVMELLFDLADFVGLIDRRDTFRRGLQRTNIAETIALPVLHHVLRMPATYGYVPDQPTVVKAVPPPPRHRPGQASTSSMSTTGSSPKHFANNTLTSADLVVLASDAGGGGSVPEAGVEAPNLNADSAQVESADGAVSGLSGASPPSSKNLESGHLHVGSLGGSDGLDLNPVTPGMNSSHHIITSGIGTADVGSHFEIAGKVDSEVLSHVVQLRNQIQAASDRVRNGVYRSVTGAAFQNVLVIGNGATTIGPECIADSLGNADPRAMSAAEGRTLRFLSNIDPLDFVRVTSKLDPAVTLVIVVSKTFADAETILNTKTIKQWLLGALVKNGDTPSKSASVDKDADTDSATCGIPAVASVSAEEVFSRHLWGVTAEHARCLRYGIQASNIFQWFDWIDKRHAVTSVVGLLPLSIQFSYAVMEDFISGAHSMDEHFFSAPVRDNLPIVMGLLGVWNSTFLGLSCRAILPYSRALNSFPTFVQYIDAGNGKRVALDGTPLYHASGEINFGSAGPSAQHTMGQLLHQGRVVPVDLIGFMEAPFPIEVPAEAVSNHDELMCHYFALPDALAYGKTLMDLIQEGVPEPLREHMVLTGNRPSTSLLLSRLDAYSLGQLVALYEHRTAVQGYIWGISSFDHYGEDYPRQLAKHVRAQLSTSRKAGASVQGFNTSTSALLDVYLNHEKFQRRSQQQHAGASYPYGNAVT